MTDRVGQHLGNYQLIKLLGQGHWAAVYLGEHQHLHTQAAIKVLHGPWTDSEVEGFLYEARTLARLRHSHIVRVLDFGVQEGTPFLVMEYAPSGTLRQLHPEGTRLPLNSVVAYVRQVASALQYAHAQQLIHRDLKPENLLLGPDQEVWLSDFGLALMAHSARSQPFQRTAGTLAYMAPEQLQGYPTPASDQYALGVLVYEWLAGERPFSGSLPELAAKQALTAPPALAEKVPTLPAGVEQIVLQALAKDPAQRFASVQAFALALEEASRADASGQTLPLLASGYSAEVGRRVASMPHLPRGTVTLLFTDIEGSTSLLQQLRERYPQVLGECRRLLRAAFQQWHGREVDTQGDAFFVAFARATDAVSAAVAAQRVLTGHVWAEGVTVQVRMGLHTGEPEFTSEGYVGLDVHHAARIMSAGHGGQILLSATTRALVEPELPAEVSLRDLGEHRLKDLQRPTHLFQVVIADLPTDFPPLGALDNHPNNLPIQPTPFIGREQEVAAIGHLLQREEVRLVTLTGPGGVGKTRLGLQVAAELSDRCADGVFFVNLAPTSDPALVMPTIAQTMGIREVAGQPLLERLTEGLRQKQLLLLLDNFEQVVSAAIQVADLLAACQELKVLVTSRAVLHVRAEHEFAVPPLALPDSRQVPDLTALSQSEAVALFLERARATKPDFQLTAANARAVAEICARLDGLPLAIELAAAHSKLLPPQALLARLNQRLAVLTSATQDVPLRQQTLRNTIKWSYDLLSPEEQRLFRRCAVFVGGGTLSAIEAVWSAHDEGADQVVEGATWLLDKSLLQQSEQEEGEPRLSMLETVREYGLEALRESGEAEASHRAHALHFLALAEEAEPHLKGAQQVLWWKRLEREQENLRAALSWLTGQEEGELALRLSAALWRFWDIRGYWSEGGRWLEAALGLTQAQARTARRAKALSGAGVLAHRSGHPAARSLLEESVAISRELGDPWLLASTLGNLGHYTSYSGDFQNARLFFEESVTLLRGLQDQQALLDTLRALVEAMVFAGQATQAAALAEESLTLARDLDNRPILSKTLYGAAEIQVFQGDPERAVALLEESLALARELGDKGDIVTAQFRQGSLALYRGELVPAETCVQEALALSRELGNKNETALALALLGEIRRRQGDLLQARAACTEGVLLASEAGWGYSIGWCLIFLARVAADEGQLEQAARLFGAAEPRVHPDIMDPLDRADYEHAVEGVQVRLGEKAFAEAWARGRTLTPEQALAANGQGMIAAPTPTEPSSASSTTFPASYPAGLTTREVDVLRLVAQGLTNEQVAQQLVISPRTVNTHLTSIFSKIGVSSRGAATRYAIEHHLA